MQDLGAFLAGQCSEGFLDSEGEFTLDTERAARKLAKFSLPDDYSWVLKLIQAAVAWECPQIKVTQRQEYSSFTFCPPGPLPTPKDVVTTVLQGSLESSAPLDRFSIALRALVEQTGLSFVLGIREQDGEVETLFAGPDTSALAEAERKSWGQLKERGIKVAVSHQLKGEYYTGRYAPRFLLKEHRDLEIAEQLIHKAFVCPVPLTLDARSLTSPLEHPEIGFAKRWRPLCLLPLRSSERLPTLPLQGPFESGLYPLFADKKIEIPESPDQAPPVGWLLWQILHPALEFGGDDHKLSGPEFFWVQDGIVIAKETAISLNTAGSRAVILLNATGLETDLTGFALKESELLEVRRSEGIALAQEALKSRLEEIKVLLEFDQEAPPLDYEQQRRKRGRKTTIKGSLAALALFKVNPVLGAGVLGSHLFLRGVSSLFPNNQAELERIQENIQLVKSALESFVDFRSAGQILRGPHRHTPNDDHLPWHLLDGERPLDF